MKRPYFPWVFLCLLEWCQHPNPAFRTTSGQSLCLICLASAASTSQERWEHYAFGEACASLADTSMPKKGRKSGGKSHEEWQPWQVSSAAHVWCELLGVAALQYLLDRLNPAVPSWLNLKKKLHFWIGKINHKQKNRSQAPTNSRDFPGSLRFESMIRLLWRYGVEAFRIRLEMHS